MPAPLSYTVNPFDNGCACGDHGLYGAPDDPANDQRIADRSRLHFDSAAVATDTVVAGEARELESRRLTARDVNWIAGPPAGSDLQARVKIRYRHAEAAATLRPLPERRVAVEFDQPQRAVTPGQAAVFYDAGVCLGGGWIE